MAAYHIGNRAGLATSLKIGFNELMRRRQRELEDMFQRTTEVKVAVRGNLFEGVAVDINGAKWNSKEIRNVTLKKVQGRIVLYANNSK